MSIKFSDVVSKGDMIKIIILLVTSSILWIWVWTESKKPLYDQEADSFYSDLE